MLVLSLLFFLSGAASLVYEVAWARSLSLVFGGSHLAVTTVLSVFMGGLALGSAIFGRRAGGFRRPLRAYGFLELGVAAMALLFLGLMSAYPHLYGPLARLGEESRVYLTAVRLAFAAMAMLGPTTLMGGTLPVLLHYATRRAGRVGRDLSLLYGVNTLGAVAGTLACGFVLLQAFGVVAAQLWAVAVNAAVGLAAVLLPEPWPGPEPAAPDAVAEPAAPTAGAGEVDPGTGRLVLWAAGVSGFCALGYEVLWTRMLSLVMGTSVYSFAIILAAFLGGIALGSKAYGLVEARWRVPPGGRVAALGVTLLLVGLAALAVTALMRSLPAHASSLQRLLARPGAQEFAVRQWSGLVIAAAYLVPPALLLGAAFPMAGTVVASAGRRSAQAVGATLSANTVGSILGAAITGLVLVHAFGAERSLQMLALANAGTGLAVLARASGLPRLAWAAAAASALLVIGRGVNQDLGRLWDAKFFAVYQNNQREAFETPEARRQALAMFDVLYFFEGASETISVIRARDGIQSFVVNGRAEASNFPEDRQLQRLLGHLPALLHPDPRRAFVLGTGSGMTLGALTLHPGLEGIVLAEIEPGVLPATRTFGALNHQALDSPKVRVVFNDGRNLLGTTRERFDVITADPIHPWSGGAAYLYTREYFRTVADHLRPGGVAAQWLPLYELSEGDVRTVVRTFAEPFQHVAVWVTYWDALLVGSNSPIALDEEALERRLASAAIRADLADIGMGSAEDLLGYFAMGTAAARAFGSGGAVNTDDNLTLEFSAPRSMGRGDLTGRNVLALVRARERLLPLLAPMPEGAVREAQVARWSRHDAAARLHDLPHVLSLLEQRADPRYRAAMARVEAQDPGYAPHRFLRALESQIASPSTVLGRLSFPVRGAAGERGTLDVSAILMRRRDLGGTLAFVDHVRRLAYGGQALAAGPADADEEARRLTRGVFARLEGAYGELAPSRAGERVPPPEAAAVARFTEEVRAALSAGR